MTQDDLILLVEDSPIDAFIHRKVIEQQGLSNNIICYPTANLALKFLEGIIDINDAPTLIFLDIRMPDLDGFDFLERFAGLPISITHKSRIIMLSSTIDESDLQKAGSNKFVLAFIPKPLTKAKLEEIFGQ